MEKESLIFDVVIVGAGPAGLSAACRLAQLSRDENLNLAIAIVEKGSEVGAHIVSGAVIESGPLLELFPDCNEQGAPLGIEVAEERWTWLRSEHKSLRVPPFLIPRPLHNRGNRIVSLGRLCRWLGERAEDLGCDLLTGFAATELLCDASGRVCGVATGPHGIGADGEPKAGADQGYELHAKYVLLAEGCHGSLGREAERLFALRAGRDPQHYGIGFKEVWTIDADRHQPGLVEHTFGWPLDNRTEGGGFVYHAEGGKLYLGFIVALSYRNPYLNPFAEFQRFKNHPAIRGLLEGSQRTGFGARAVNKGGLHSLPRLSFPGGLLIGCDAGFLNGAKIKGAHTAIQSGVIAAETVAHKLAADGAGGEELMDFEDAFRASLLYKELKQARNFSAGVAKFGTFAGGALAFLEHNVLRGRSPFSLKSPIPDYAKLETAAASQAIDYPKPDGRVTFDRLSSIHLANLEHDEDQPGHLLLRDADVPIDKNLPRFDEPATRYCPAGVYEVLQDAATPVFRINAANCIHCKTCEIKDPAQNIRWVPPEGGSGPNYSDL